MPVRHQTALELEAAHGVAGLGADLPVGLAHVVPEPLKPLLDLLTLAEIEPRLVLRPPTLDRGRAQDPVAEQRDAERVRVREL